MLPLEADDYQVGMAMKMSGWLKVLILILVYSEPILFNFHWRSGNFNEANPTRTNGLSTVLPSWLTHCMLLLWLALQQCNTVSALGLGVYWKTWDLTPGHAKHPVILRLQGSGKIYLQTIFPRPAPSIALSYVNWGWTVQNDWGEVGLGIVI